MIYKNISFAAGNEYRYFDNSKINLTNLKVYKTQLNDFYNSFLTSDYDRNKISYEYNPDKNGLFFISQNIDNPILQNDYSKDKGKGKKKEGKKRKKGERRGEGNNEEGREKKERRKEEKEKEGKGEKRGKRKEGEGGKKEKIYKK